MTLEIFPGMLGLPEGQKFNLGIFFKILFAWSSLWPRNII